MCEIMMKEEIKVMSWLKTQVICEMIDLTFVVLKAGQKKHESQKCRVSADHPVYWEAGFQPLLLSLQEYVAYPVMT